jgi:hypothetical protein
MIRQEFENRSPPCEDLAKSRVETTTLFENSSMSETESWLLNKNKTIWEYKLCPNNYLVIPAFN